MSNTRNVCPVSSTIDAVLPCSKITIGYPRNLCCSCCYIRNSKTSRFAASNNITIYSIAYNIINSPFSREYFLIISIIYYVRTITCRISIFPFERDLSSVANRKSSFCRSFSISDSPSIEDYTCQCIHDIDCVAFPTIVSAVGKFISYFAHVAAIAQCSME